MMEFIPPLFLKKLDDIKSDGIAAQGRGEYIDILQGKDSTYRKRCLAKCYDCSGFYTDGKRDCRCDSCPLHGVMPYRGVI